MSKLFRFFVIFHLICGLQSTQGTGYILTDGGEDLTSPRVREDLPSLGQLGEYFEQTSDIWKKDTVKNAVVYCYQVFGSHIVDFLERPKNSKESNVFQGQILLKTFKFSPKLYEQKAILTMLGFNCLNNEEPALLIPALTHDHLPAFFEQGYPIKKSNGFWDNQEVIGLKERFFPTAKTLFFQPYDGEAYSAFAEEVMAAIKKTAFFRKTRKQKSQSKKKPDLTHSVDQKVKLSIQKTSDFMRSLGLSSLNLSDQGDGDILLKGTRIRQQVLPKINLGKNNKRRIMLYDHGRICAVKSLPLSASLRPEKHYREVTVKGRKALNTTLRRFMPLRP